MRRNWNQVCEYFERTITSRVIFGRRKKLACCLFARPLGNGSGRAMISPTKQVFAFQGLKHCGSHVDNLGLGETGPRRNGWMEQNFPVIPIFRNIGTSSRGTPEIPKWDSGKCPFHSLFNRNFRNFWSNGKRPKAIGNSKLNECL